MSVEEVNSKVKNAATIGAIELMLSPDYGDSFLQEAAVSVFPRESLTDEILSSVRDVIDAKLMELGAILFSELDDEYRKNYRAAFPNQS